MILLYCMMLTYDMTASLCLKLGLYLHAALRSFPYLESYVLESVNNQPDLWGKPEGMPSPTLLPPLSPSGWS